MILSKKSKSLTKEEWVQQETGKILSKVTEADILYAFWPANKELKLDRGGISSPFRADDTPSLLIGIKDGHVVYKDMGALEYRGSIWKFVQQIEGLKSFSDVLKKVDDRFNLGIWNQKIEGVSSIITWKQPEAIIKAPTVIQVVARKPNREELQYWNSYHQDISDIKRENIFMPKEIYRNRKKQPIELLTFCYYCPEIDAWKLYRPYAPKRTKNTPPHMWKWDNSIGNLQYIEGLQNLKNCKVGVVNKARKCRMVIQKATGINSICNLQAEDPSAITEEDMQWIDENCETKVAVMDSDKKGKEMSWWLTTKRGYKHCNTPDKYLPEVNDMAEMGKVYGLDSITKHWQSKGLI